MIAEDETAARGPKNMWKKLRVEEQLFVVWRMKMKTQRIFGAPTHHNNSDTYLEMISNTVSSSVYGVDGICFFFCVVDSKNNSNKALIFLFSLLNSRHSSSLFFRNNKSQALSGFLMMLTQNGKLLYISDNAAEYLGHSMEDLLIHGDSVYDIIDKQDYNAIQSELSRTGSHNIHQSPSSLLHHHSVNMDGEKRMFLCRMNVSRWDSVRIKIKQQRWSGAFLMNQLNH